MLLRKVFGGLLAARPEPQPRPQSARPAVVLVLMCPTVGRHREVFEEVLEVVAAGLDEIGHASTTVMNEFLPGHDHIVFCPRLLRAEDVHRVPASTVLYNFEPLELPVFDSRQAFVTEYAPRFRVWDYSAANVRYLNGLGIAAQHVPLGYAATLTRIERAPQQDIDVLFYGEMTPRRVRVLDALRAAGLNVTALADLYGRERDALIARAKVVLNVHNHDDIRALETPRVFYLLANSKAVVTEAKHDVEIDEDLRASMLCAPYDGLVEACISLAADGGRRAALGEAAFRCIGARSEARILAAALGAGR